MRKTAIRKDSFREIKNSIGRFLSILLIIAVGTGVFVSLKATAPSMYHSAESFFTETALYDLEIFSTIGFGDDDVKAIKKIDGIDRVMAGYSIDALYDNAEEEEKVVKIMSLPDESDDNINTPLIIEGQMPKKSDECVVAESEDTTGEFHVGDKITLKDLSGSTDISTALGQKVYTISGIARMPMYISYGMGTSSIGSGSVQATMMVSKSNFKYSRYTEVFLTLECHQNGISAFDGGYQEELNRIVRELDEVSLKQYQTFINLNQKKIDAAEAELKKSQNEADEAFSKAEKELSDAEYALWIGQQQLSEGERQYASASEETRARLSNARSELDNGWNTYNFSKTEYDTSLQTYKASLASYEAYLSYYSSIEAVVIELEEQLHSGTTTGFVLSDATWKSLQSILGLTDDEIQSYKEQLASAEVTTLTTLVSLARSALSQIKTYLDESKQTLDESKGQLDAAKIQLDEALVSLNGREKEYSAAKAQAESELAEAKAKISSSTIELQNAREKYYYGLAEYNKEVQQAKEELKNGQSQIQNAKLQLEEVKDGKWYCLNRKESMFNYSNFVSDANRIDALANVFPIFFFLVAALVCISTMTRMVEEQRMQIGTYKALGYKSGEIVSKFVIYAAIAGLIGSVFGVTIFVLIIPRVIFSAYHSLYMLPWFNIEIPWMMAGIAVIITLLCTVFVTWLACVKELKSHAASLMRPKSPKAGKKIFLEKISFLWKRFSFFQKLTSRNLLRYKKRMFMTVIGILGGTALIIAGFGLQNAIGPILNLEFTEISHYDATIYLNDPVKNNELSATMKELESDKRVDEAFLIKESEIQGVDIDETTIVENAYLRVPQSLNDFCTFISLRDPETKSSLILDDDGVIITQKLADQLNVKAGDEMFMKIGSQKYRLEVKDITECYIYHYVYMTSAYYKKLMGEEVEYNAVYMISSPNMTDQETFSSEWLEKSDNIVNVHFMSESEEIMADIMSSLMFVVLVLIICSGILTFIVLYNLTNTNISERLREIATVKVLGFNAKEVNRYVFRENIVMAIVGILLGCFAGYFLAQLIISTVEVSMVAFCREIRFSSYLYAALLTMFFTLMVNFFMSKRIKKISMVESLKAVE